MSNCLKFLSICTLSAGHKEVAMKSVQSLSMIFYINILVALSITQCPEIDVISSKRALNRHKLYIHGIWPKETCETCGKDFRSAGDLNEHIKSAYRESYVCEDCGKVLLNKQSYKNHIKWHEKEFYCIQCGATLKGKEQYFVHTNRHENEADDGTKMLMKKGKEKNGW